MSLYVSHLYLLRYVYVGGLLIGNLYLNAKFIVRESLNRQVYILTKRSVNNLYDLSAR